MAAEGCHPEAELSVVLGDDAWIRELNETYKQQQAATDVLARPDANTVAIFGSGVQARTQLEAVCTVRDIQHVRVFSLDKENISSFIQDVQKVSYYFDNVSLA